MMTRKGGKRKKTNIQKAIICQLSVMSYADRMTRKIAHGFLGCAHILEWHFFGTSVSDHKSRDSSNLPKSWISIRKVTRGSSGKYVTGFSVYSNITYPSFAAEKCFTWSDKCFRTLKSDSLSPCSNIGLSEFIIFLSCVGSRHLYFFTDASIE